MHAGGKEERFANQAGYWAAAGRLLSHDGKSREASAAFAKVVALSPEEMADFNAVKRADIYGDDDAAALRDLLFSWWEERFLQAHAGAPAIEGQ